MIVSRKRAFTHEMRTWFTAAMLIALDLVSAVGVAAAQSEPQLVQQLSNPIADLIQVPFQHNFDRGGGPSNTAFRYTVNFQPVIPIRLNNDWNFVTRTIVPFVSFGNIFPQTESGIGDTIQSFFLSPARPTSSGIVWGMGPAFLYPTATNAFFAGQQWGVGPTGVILKLEGPGLTAFSPTIYGR